jgi:hypothetical protein
MGHGRKTEQPCSPRALTAVIRLDKALDEAEAKHWVVTDMKNDWKTVFPENS